MSIVIITGICLIINLVIGLTMQSFSTNSVFFGVRVPLGYEKKDTLIKERKKFNKHWIITWIVSTIMFFLLSLIASPEMVIFLMMFFIFLQLGLMELCYYFTYKRVKQIKLNENWRDLLSPEKIVYADLNIRKDVEKSFNKKLFFIPVGIFIISLIAYVIKGTSSDIYLLISQLFLLIVIQFSVWSIDNSKQNFNGGTLKSLRMEAFKSRKFLVELVFIVDLTTMISLTIGMLSSLNIISSLWANIGFIFTIITSFATVVMAFIGAYNIKKFANKESGMVDDNSAIINRDDDDNYLMGMIYYNPNDPSLMVEKRMGIGMTFNMAKPAAKIFSVITFVFIIGIMIMPFVFFNNVDYEVTNTALDIKGIYSQEIAYKDVTSVEIIDKLPKIEIRTNGADLGVKKIGYFNLKDIQGAKLYVLNSNNPCVKLVLNNKKVVFINLENNEDTTKLYNQLRENIDKS